jgi:hypothetical protein
MPIAFATSINLTFWMPHANLTRCLIGNANRPHPFLLAVILDDLTALLLGSADHLFIHCVKLFCGEYMIVSRAAVIERLANQNSADYNQDE